LKSKRAEEGARIRKQAYSNYGKVRSEITHLEISHENLTGPLNLTDFTLLIELDCSYNNLTHLIIPVQVKVVACVNNQLTTLNLTNLTSLETLNCNDNHLTNLNLYHNLELTCLRGYRNQLTKLILSPNNKIIEF
jgi:hypothetical protein